MDCVQVFLFTAKEVRALDAEQCGGLSGGHGSVHLPAGTAENGHAVMGGQLLLKPAVHGAQVRPDRAGRQGGGVVEQGEELGTAAVAAAAEQV